MPYGLQRDEDLAAGLKRITDEQLAEAIASLQSKADIYGARKNLKKARSVLRLVAPQLGPVYAEENRRLRDVARRFSALRDTQVSLELLPQFGGVRNYRKALEEKRRACDSAGIAQSIQDLAATRKRIEDWHLHDVTEASLQSQLRKTEKQSRQARKQAAKTRTAADFHEYRKSVKRQLNQQRLLSEPAPDLKKLATLLGDHHNLAVLLTTVDNPSARFRTRVQRQMKKLESQILLTISQPLSHPNNNYPQHQPPKPHPAPSAS